MGFLDDLGKGLNKVGKKTSDMAAIAKLKLEITKNKSSIDKKYEELGSRIYFLNKEGVSRDESIDTLITEIDDLFISIKNIEIEIEKISVDNQKTETHSDTFKCNSCGADLPMGTKFCGSCGNKIEEIVQAPVVGKKCPNCEAEVGDAKFCNSCGTSID